MSNYEKEGEEIIPLRPFITREELEYVVENAFNEWMQSTNVTRDMLIDAIVQCIKNPIK